MRTESVHVRFYKVEFFIVINKILGIYLGSSKQMQTTSAERQHMLRGYLSKKRELGLIVSRTFSFDVSGNIFNVTSSTPFLNEVCIEPEIYRW